MIVMIDEISAALQDGNMKAVEKLVEKALQDGISAKEILEKGLLSGMDVVAAKFKNDEIFVPEVLVAARAMSAGTALLAPHLAESGAKPIGTVLLGTVRGDLHDIGKNLVRMMFEGKGIKVIDLGIDVPPERFLEAYKAERPDAIALSALLTTTMREMKNTIDIFTESGFRDDVIIMIGGAPVTDEFRKSIKADIYEEDAASAAYSAKEAILERRAHQR